jgi:hypothetical protein
MPKAQCNTRKVHKGNQHILATFACKRINFVVKPIPVGYQSSTMQHAIITFHVIRLQIIRITAASSIAPQGFLDCHPSVSNSVVSVLWAAHSQERSLSNQAAWWLLLRLYGAVSRPRLCRCVSCHLDLPLTCQVASLRLVRLDLPVSSQVPSLLPLSLDLLVCHPGLCW